MGLISECAIDQTKLPVGTDELLMERTGGSTAAIRSLDTSILDTQDKAFDMDAVIRRWKADGKLPPGNRTVNEKEIYESCTGELYMDCPNKFMTINTPRLQGLCGEAGTKTALPNFEVVSMNRRGNMTLAAIDGMKAIAEADKLLLFTITNVLNTGMVFESDDMITRVKNGNIPLVMETGNFEFVIKTPKAPTMKVYALGLDGERLQEMPTEKIAGGLRLKLDTAKIKNGPAHYFEITTR